MYFFNNYATKLGAGIYMDDTSSDFTLSILNIGCFIRYNTREVDLPPNEWVRNVIKLDRQREIILEWERRKRGFFLLKRILDYFWLIYNLILYTIPSPILSRYEPSAPPYTS